MESPEIIGGRYRLEESIGRGGMATIYRAVDEQMMGRVVAVKVLREVYSNDPKFVTRFQREARAASALQHPNIVQVYDYGQSDERYYIVMEYIDGMDLRRYLKRRGGILPVERAVEIARAVSLGLGAAHKRGIVHRDVKPQNVMVNEDGLVKLTDFGIASMYKDADAERLTTTGMTLGTVQYYAPEQAQGEIVRPSADVYALGIVMYEMLAGRTPFDGDTPVAVAMKHIQEEPEPPSQFNPRIPPQLERIILRCLAKDPSARFRDGDELANTLANFLRAPARRGGPVSAPRDTGGRYGAELYESPAQGPNGRISGPRPNAGGYGMPGPTSGPRATARPPVSVNGRPAYGNLSDDPTYDGPPTYDNGGPYGGYGGFPASDTLRAEAADTRGRMRRPTDEPPGRGGLIAAIIGAALVVLVVGSILVLAVTQVLPGLGAAPQPTVPVVKTFSMPNYIDPNHPYTCTDAVADATAKGLKASCVSQASSKPTNQVIDQNPAADSSVKAGDTVTFTDSAGLASILMPNVIGQQYNTAAATLVNAGLTVFSIQQPNDKYPFGTVFQTNPPAGTKIQPTSAPTSTQVTVYVSLGPAPTPTPAATATPTATATATPTCIPTPTVAPTSTPSC